MFDVEVIEWMSDTNNRYFMIDYKLRSDKSYQYQLVYDDDNDCLYSWTFRAMYNGNKYDERYFMKKIMNESILKAAFEVSTIYIYNDNKYPITDIVPAPMYIMFGYDELLKLAKKAVIDYMI